LQRVEARVSLLVLAITTYFSCKCLAVIIDDVWDLEELDKLGLLLDCKSSHMVTSREVVPATSMYVGFNLTGECNRAQEQAILASSLAKDPTVDTVQPHLQVQLHFVRCCHT
jgi:hypothetical protein